MSASMLPFSAHFVTLLIAAVYWSRRSARLHSSIRGLSPQAGGFRRRSNRPSSVSRVSGLAHVPNERLPCVQQVLTIHLLFRIILQYTAVFQPRVPSLFRGTRNIIPTDPENLRIFSDVVASVGLRGSCGAQAKGRVRRGDFSMVRIRLARFALPRLGYSGSKSDVSCSPLVCRVRGTIENVRASAARSEADG